MVSTLLFTLAQAAPAQPPPNYFAPLYLVFFGVIIYFMLIRPQQRQRKQQQELIGSLKKGDRVITTGGLHGTVAFVKEGSTVSVLIAEGVRVDVEKVAITTVQKTDSEAAAGNAAKA